MIPFFHEDGTRARHRWTNDQGLQLSRMLPSKGTQQWRWVLIDRETLAIGTAVHIRDCIADWVTERLAK